MNAKQREKLLKKVLKNILALGVSDEQEDLIEKTFAKFGECLHSGWDANNKCVRCGKQLKK